MPEPAFEIRGADELERLAKRLKESGRNDLRKQLLRGIREAGKPVIPKIRASALANLPRRGGLAAEVARGPLGVRTKTSGKSVGVTIARRRGRGLNAGRLRHPVFGNKDVWVQQPVSSGWFEEPIEKEAPGIRRGVEKAMRDVADEIAKGL